jgi:hypothetical protein
VAALRTADLLIRRGSPSQVHVLIRPVGSLQSYTPDAIWAGPGDVVELTVQQLLSTSVLFLR